MVELQRYYSLKRDVENLEKFSNEYFISQERKDGKASMSYDFKLNGLYLDKTSIGFENRASVAKYFAEASYEVAPELITVALEKMNKDLSELREEIKTKCSEFLTNECGSN